MDLRPAVAAALLLAAPAARAGLVIGTRNTQGTNAGQEGTVYIEGNKLASDSAGDQAHFFIWDGDANKVVLGDRAQKTYQEMTPSDVTGMKARMSKQLEEAKARMSPEQRKALEEMLGKQGAAAAPAAKPPETEYVPASGGDRVLGHACKNYREVREGRTVAETCFIPWSDGVVTRADLAPLEKMEQFWRPLSEQQPGARRRQAMSEELARAPGVPAIRKTLGADGKPESEERLTKLDRTRVPAERFQVPAGYTRSKRQLGE
ncbi:hypothetical protein [Anaeromyxobacter paludicola]|uniref:DUF4412 domain-containing protein n=1 Tax=Anaeromyxobacter paludicola TaxID=2918171 RepID=A0ABM7XA64_9BACT|nr:hypothetical protein [Anaeromyxobacter paludicola]BDG08746.1 hypothetical protein AMPC_18590 [Anaeromyxobacter paludicola]